jgi:hypothetical protein
VPTVPLVLTPFNSGGAAEYVLVDKLVAYDFLSAEQ